MADTAKIVIEFEYEPQVDDYPDKIKTSHEAALFDVNKIGIFELLAILVPEMIITVDGEKVETE